MRKQKRRKQKNKKKEIGLKNFSKIYSPSSTFNKKGLSIYSKTLTLERLKDITYPSFLIEGNHDGQFKVHLYFNNRGKADLKNIRIHGNNRILKAHLKKELKRLLFQFQDRKLKNGTMKFFILFRLNQVPTSWETVILSNQILSITRKGTSSKRDKTISGFTDVLTAINNIFYIPAKIKKAKENKVKIEKLKESEEFQNLSY